MANQVKYDPLGQGKTIDIDDLENSPEMRKYIRQTLMDRKWGDSWIGNFALGFLGATDDGVFYVIFLYLTLYLLIAIGWVLLLEVDVIRDEIMTENFTGAFQPVTFVIAFITRDLVADATNKMIGAAKLYVEMQQQIRHLAIIMGGVRKSILASPPDKMYAKLGDLKNNEETKENAMRHIDDIRGYLMVMALNSYRLFNSADEAMDYKQFEFDHYENIAEHALGAARLYGRDSTLIMNGCITLITDEIEHMNERSIISSGICTVSHNILSNLLNTNSQIWISQHIAPPPIFDQLYDLILKFYLFIMVPLQILSAINRFWTILVYPLVIIIYTAPVVLGDWLRSPFNPNARWEGPPLLAYRNLLYRHIEHRLGDPAKKRVKAPVKRLLSKFDHAKGVSTLSPPTIV